MQWEVRRLCRQLHVRVDVGQVFLALHFYVAVDPLGCGWVLLQLLVHIGRGNGGVLRAHLNDGVLLLRETSFHKRLGV